MSKASKLDNNDIPNETTWCKDISNQKSGASLGEQKEQSKTIQRLK